MQEETTQKTIALAIKTSKLRVYKIPMVRMFALAGGLTNLRMYRSKRRPRRNVWVR